MIRDRLKKLERLVAEAISNCPGCLQIPARFEMPGLPARSTESVRCARCGREHQPTVVRFIVPGLTRPKLVLD
jgi:hypothetical protein